MRMYFENQKNPFYEKKFARIVLNNTVRLYWCACWINFM